MQPQLLSLHKKVLGKYIKPCDLADAIKSSTLLSIDYKNGWIRVTDEELVLGYNYYQAKRKVIVIVL